VICVVLGVDPGPTPGIVRLVLQMAGYQNLYRIESVEVVQCTAGALVPVLNGLADVPESATALAYEGFVSGPRASRSSTPAAGKTTRDMTRDLAAWAAHHDIPSHTYRATDVKPWATDERLDRAGLLEPTKGMRHARDGARHALYSAVKHYGLPDPLSRRSR
jgi:hypothetical protein